MKSLSAILILIMSAACSTTPTKIGERVTLHRDKWGTPHVVADDLYGAYYGYGYAVAEDRLFQMEMLKRTTQGKVAEVLGPDFLDLDRMIRTHYDFRSVARQIGALNNSEREVLRAYAEGFNRYLNKVESAPEKYLPLEFSHYDFAPTRWSEFDVAMLFVGSIAHRYSDFNSERDNLAILRALERVHGADKAWKIFNASKWLLDAESPTTVPSSERPYVDSPKAKRPRYLSSDEALPKAAAVVMDEQGLFAGVSDRPEHLAMLNRQLASRGPESQPQFAPASNYWAVTGSRLSDADGALVNGPQFDWGVPSYVYGIGMHTPEFKVVGNTLLGMPNLLFAHNGTVAWGSTAGLSDQVDEYTLQLHPNDDDLYWHGGGYRRFDSWKDIIQVRGQAPVEVTVRRASQGMVLSFSQQDRQAVARARAWEGGELASMMAWVFLAQDKTLDAVKQRLANVTTNINFYYMDAEGNLGYTHGGRYPQRMAGHDSRFPAPGSGEYDWSGYKPYSNNPTTRNPEQGYIANWNNRPSADWISIDLWSYTWTRADRVKLLFDALEDNPVMSANEIWQINREVTHADVTAPFLLPHLFTSVSAADLSAYEQSAFELLRDWDQQWRADTEGFFPAEAALFERWLERVLEVVLKDDIGEKFDPYFSATNLPTQKLGASMGTSPGSKVLIATLDDLAAGKMPAYDFFNSAPWQSVLATTFQDSVKELQAEFGAEFSEWKVKAEPMRWKRFNFRGVPQALEQAEVSVPVYMNRGSENNFFIARDGQIRGWDVIPPGQSGYVSGDNKLGTHTRDQMQMFSEFAYKAIPFSLDEVIDASVRKEVLSLDYFP